MSSIYVVVEGQTEQTFVRDVLSPYLGAKNIHLYPCLIGIPGHRGGNVSFERAVNDIRSFFKQQEINDNPEKAPSKRLKILKKGYRKVAMGKIISETIGIQEIRNQCNNFNAWVTRLEE